MLTLLILVLTPFHTYTVTPESTAMLILSTPTISSLIYAPCAASSTHNPRQDGHRFELLPKPDPSNTNPWDTWPPWSKLIFFFLCSLVSTTHLSLLIARLKNPDPALCHRSHRQVLQSQILLLVVGLIVKFCKTRRIRKLQTRGTAAALAERREVTQITEQEVPFGMRAIEALHR
jgi:hypothetical protein